MFDRSERFNDRYSDIYCDRRTGGRFSDKFSDRCSDRYSDRFSDTESLHNEVRTKLTTLQKAVKQKKRLSVSTWSSSEFESESVASESSYADYVEKLRVKPASLPDVQQFNRPFDSGDAQKEFPGRSSTKAPHMRHSFEPQSRTRAIQIMKGELIDTLEPERKPGEEFSTEERKLEGLVESQGDATYNQTVSDRHRAAADQKVEASKLEVELRRPEVPHTETSEFPNVTTHTESRDSGGVSQEEQSRLETSRPKAAREKLLGEMPGDTETTKSVDQYSEEGAGESLRAHYEKSLDAERIQCEEKLLALRIRKWQQGSRMSDEEAFQPEPYPSSETPYMEPPMGMNLQQEVTEKRITVETEAKPATFQKSPRTRTRTVDPEGANVSSPKSPKVRGEEGEILTVSTTMKTKPEEGELPGEVPGILPRKVRARAAGVETAVSPRTLEAKVESRFVCEASTPETGGGEGAGETVKSLEAERFEAKVGSGLRTRKWDEGGPMSPGGEPEVPDVPRSVERQQEVVERRGTGDQTAVSTAPRVTDRVRQEVTTSAPQPKARVRTKPGLTETEASVSTRLRTKAAEAEGETTPRTRARAEKMLFEKTREERELQLSRENISELKNESEKFVSEEEALTQRIMMWQQNVLMEQEQALKPESDWVEGFPAEVTESQPRVVQTKTTSTAKTSRDKFLLSEAVPPGFQDQEGDSKEGRETRLQRDSEYFVSEEEALAQRILKWQQDAVEQEEVEESEWTLDQQGRPPGPGGMFESQLPDRDLSPAHTTTTMKQAPPLGEYKAPPPPLYGSPPPPPYGSPLPPPPPHAAPAQREGEGFRYVSIKERTAVEEMKRSSEMPFEGHELVSEGPRRPSREGSSARRRSPQQNLESERSKTGDQRIGQTFQSELRAESSGETTERRKQKDFGGVRKEEGSVEMRPENLGAIKKDDRRVRGESTVKEGVHQTPEGRRTEGGGAGGSRPVFVMEISSVKVRIGEMSEFSCRFLGDPQPGVTWLKDGHPLAHNPDYEITTKSDQSRLTVFYPTTDHEGTYDCVITNKHGKSICSGTLDISDKRVAKRSGVTREVLVTEEPEKQEVLEEEEVQAYMDSGKATLQVPQAVIHRPQLSSESLGSTPVEIRITAATPLPEMKEEVGEEEVQAPAERTSDVPSEEKTSTTGKHVFTFSFDVAAEAPQAVSEVENISCSEGKTATIQCVITGESDVSWYRDGVSIEMLPGKHSTEVSGNVHRLNIDGFTSSDAGIYSCVARNKAGEVTSSSQFSLHSGESKMFSEEGGVSPFEEGGVTPFEEGGVSPFEEGGVSPFEEGGVTPFEEGGVILSEGRGVTSPERLSRSENVQKPVAFHKAAAVHPEDLIVQTKDKSLISDVAKAPKSRTPVSRAPPTASGCGLAASAAVIKVSQIKQAFESDSPVASTTSPSPEQQRRTTVFPEEFIPAVALDQQEPDKPDRSGNPGSPKAAPGRAGPDLIPTSETQAAVAPKPVSPKTSSSLEGDWRTPEIPAGVEEGAALAERLGGVTQFVEEVQESPLLVRPKAQKPVQPQQVEAYEVKMAAGDAVRTFDRVSSFIPFQPEKVPAVRSSARAPAEVKTKISSEPIKPERQSRSKASSLIHSEAEHVGSVLAGDDLVSVPEPSMDSGVFMSLPESQDDVAEAAEEEISASAVEPRTEIRAEDEQTEDQLKVEPEVIVGKTNVQPAGVPAYAAAEEPQSLVSALQDRRSLFKASAAEPGAAAASFGSMEEEEVTFGAVYDYYNPPSDWGRPLSPESEMSIEIGSTVSEELAEAAERFYTPGSSTEVSQPIAQSFHTPKSHMSLQTPSSDSAGGFMTPQEFPFSPIEHKRPPTGDSNERFFSPLQFLQSPGDEGIESPPPEITVDENRYLTKGLGSLGLGNLQEKVQGIPPAFLKPLVKKRVFENESLSFYAEVFGLPSPEVRWFCNQTQLMADERVKMERDGDSIALTIANVTKADQGEYICEAVNYVGEARSVALVVVVSQEVRFLPAPPAVTHQHVMEFNVEDDEDGDSSCPSPQEILLEVELDENEVKEFEKQVKIVTIPEYTADNKSMIISLDVLPSIYEEGVVDFVTQEHDDLKIAFEVTEMPPRYINPICDMETPEGTTVMFECSLMGIPSPIVSWFKGDRKIPHNNKKYFHSSDGDNHFLKIFKVTAQDSGVYTCRAINVVGETLCRASLVVLNAKAFSGKTRGRELTAVSLGSAKIQPQKFDLVVGNTSLDSEQVSEIELEFEFDQEADESQRAVRLVAKTDDETSEQGEKYVSVNFDVFAEPAKDNKVEFKGKSSDTCSFQFQVTETAPKCVIPLTNVTAAVGTPVILQCLVSGKPNPTAEWFKDGERVTDARCLIQEKTAGHFNLLITNVTQSDAGEYKCIIQNAAGVTETAALLKVF